MSRNDFYAFPVLDHIVQFSGRDKLKPEYVSLEIQR